MSQISEQFYQRQDSWYYERIVAEDGYRFRAEIRRNAYDCQSHRIGWCFDPSSNSWQQLVWKPIAGAACFDISYTKKDPPIALFQMDARDILGDLREIVGLPR